MLLARDEELAHRVREDGAGRGGIAASVTNQSAWSSAANPLSPTTPHLLWSATTATRRAEATSARLVCASMRLGVVSPASSVTPCAPRTSRSTWREPIARSASGPTSAAEGVGEPPVSSRAGAPAAGSPPAARTSSATGRELVTIVSRGTPSSRAATACAVVPPETATTLPGSTRAAAVSAMAALAAPSRSALASNPGSWPLVPAAATAPP